MNLCYSRDEKEIDKYKYLIMLDLKENDLDILSRKDKVVSKYMEELERVNEDPSFWEYMSAEEDNRKIENSLRKQYMREGHEEGMKQGIKQGIKEGKKQGIKQGKELGEKENCIAIARLMRQKGLDSNLIKEITGIDVSND